MEPCGLLFANRYDYNPKDKYQALFCVNDHYVNTSEWLVNQNKSYCTETIASIKTDDNDRPITLYDLKKKQIAIVLLLWRILDNMWLFVSRQLSDSKHWHTVLLLCGSILPFEKQIIWLKKKEDILSN